MTDLISRQMAIDAMGCLNDSICEQQAVDALWELPSAEKTGCLEWRKEKTIWQTGYYCSECQAFFGKDYDMIQYFNFCPNCGAKMEIEE